MLKEVKKSLESHIVLDCDTNIILTVLEQAEDVGLMDDYHSFIITSLVSWKKNTNLVVFKCLLFINHYLILNLSVTILSTATIIWKQ